jgi:hypothetical protein
MKGTILLVESHLKFVMRRLMNYSWVRMFTSDLTHVWWRERNVSESTWVTDDGVYCAPCRFFGPYVNCIRFQIKLNPLHIWQNKNSKSNTYLYYIALLNILFLKIFVQKLTCCSWKLGFRGIIFSARKLQECRILHHLPSTRHLNRFEYTSFWGSYAPDVWLPMWAYRVYLLQCPSKGPHNLTSTGPHLS